MSSSTSYTTREPFAIYTCNCMWFQFQPLKHSVWKSPKIVSLEFSILAFFTNVCLIEIDYLVTLFWTQAKVFQWWRRLFLWFSNTVRVRHLLKNPWHRNNQRTLKQNIQFWSQKILDFFSCSKHVSAQKTSFSDFWPNKKQFVLSPIFIRTQMMLVKTVISIQFKNTRNQK